MGRQEAQTGAVAQASWALQTLFLPNSSDEAQDQSVSIPKSLSWVMHYLLFYEVGEGYVERRTPFRSDHLALARKFHDQGDLVLAGALADPVDGAVLVFRNREAAEAFPQSDPYVRNGVIKSWRIREWTTVIGDGASVPV